ncbi:cell wall hydrolase [Entomobacter blattae]|uniref:Cell Wall Hydrolase n=1 Tax=Entomobacter blattae TaxID=2762277 RepID=A0A7H1NUK3_9PROT|nr:cell wall hydrolase [Entomobacter blattae]QNT79463.1 Cell Wall Hydrolase [Entomobacter blattae]
MKTPQKTALDQVIDIVARTLWGEARGEGIKGMQAVANVIGNRVKTPGWWGNDYTSVCLKKSQFSCWNADDPNRDKLLKVTAEDTAFTRALTLAALLVKNNLPDLTKGATHYFEKHIAPPKWADPAKKTITIGNHIFYKLEGK